MLKPNEFAVLELGEAKPLSLVLPTSKYEQPFLVVGIGEERFAVFLGDDHRFHAMDLAEVDNWKGLAISDVRIELDETSIFDARETSAVAGSLIRSKTTLAIAALFDQRYSGGRTSNIVVEDGLPACSEPLAVGFTRWQLVLGEGLDRRTLREIDVASTSASQNA